MDLLLSVQPSAGHSGVRASWSALSEAVESFRVTQAGSVSAVRIVYALHSLEATQHSSEAIQHPSVAVLTCFAVEAGRTDSVQDALERWMSLG